MHERQVVLFAGGGSGGHLYPALALCDALALLRPDVRPVFVGSLHGLEARVLPERGLEHILLPVRGFHRGQLVENAGFLSALVVSLDQVAEAFHRLRPELVVLTGGYASGPAGVMAVLRGVPLAVQEQNAVPGVTARVLSRWSKQVHVAFPEAVRHFPAGVEKITRVTGNPIRPPTRVDTGAVRAELRLDPHRRVVIVVGGSQGSAALNALVTEAVVRTTEAPGSPPADWQLLWATGPNHVKSVVSAFEQVGGAPWWVRIVGYIDDMPSALSVADLALSRAGAMATSEFLAWGLPAVLVPLPTSAAGHQEQNARALSAAGAAVHMPQEELTATSLWRELAALMGDPSRLKALSVAALERGRPDAAKEIAKHLANLLPTPAVYCEGGAR
ncbi:MAG: undecaprenyldiphospho-muramoylpentapeptide beta-N-acetylglucosaminyltransferase [Gemmatimonadota bacterium]|nr:MAG: undecaprenyldiphospho-muramoylpentapeptide beta-N-acetylglucosaminyltransferase [Gemmatimonadota bacterium]